MLIIHIKKYHFKLTEKLDAMMLVIKYHNTKKKN